MKFRYGTFALSLTVGYRVLFNQYCLENAARLPYRNNTCINKCAAYSVVFPKMHFSAADYVCISGFWGFTPRPTGALPLVAMGNFGTLPAFCAHPTSKPWLRHWGPLVDNTDLPLI